MLTSAVSKSWHSDNEEKVKVDDDDGGDDEEDDEDDESPACRLERRF